MTDGLLGWLHAHDGHVALVEVVAWAACVVVAARALRTAWGELPVGHRRALLGIGAAATAISLLGFPLGRFDALGHEASYYEVYLGQSTPSNAHGWEAYVTYPLLRWGYWAIGGIVGRDAGPVPLIAVNAVARGVAVIAFGWFAAVLARRPDVGVVAAVLLALHPVHAFWGASFFNVSIAHAGMALCLLAATLAWRTGDGRLLLLAAASGCLVTAVRVEWGFLAPCLALLLFGGLGRGWGRHAAVATVRFWAPALAFVALYVPALLASGGAITEQGGYHSASGYLASIGRQVFWLNALAPWQAPWMLACVAFGLGAWSRDEGIGWRGPAAVAGFAVLAHLGMATFNDYGYRHALLAGFPILFGASFAAARLRDEGGTRYVAGALLAAALLTSLAGVWDARTRYYGAEEQFVASVPGFGGTELVAKQLEDGSCYLVTDNERLWEMGVSGSHFNLMDPGEAVHHWRRHDGCVLWLYDRSQWRWDSLGPRDRADKLRFWFTWETQGWVTFQDGLVAVVERMTSPPWGIGDDEPLPATEFNLEDGVESEE